MQLALDPAGTLNLDKYSGMPRGSRGDSGEKPFQAPKEAHHAVMDPLEWPREDAKLTQSERDAAVGEVIELVSSVDCLLQAQRTFDTEYFLKFCKPSFTSGEIEQLEAALFNAYRWQHIFSGVEHERYQALLGELTTNEQRERLGAALLPLRESSF